MCCSMYFLFVLFYVLFVCKYVLLPPGVNPIAVKYIISNSNMAVVRKYSLPVDLNATTSEPIDLVSKVW
jgi:hypothetical protein